MVKRPLNLPISFRLIRYRLVIITNIFTTYVTGYKVIEAGIFIQCIVEWNRRIRWTRQTSKKKELDQIRGIKKDTFASHFFRSPASVKRNLIQHIGVSQLGTYSYTRTPWFFFHDSMAAYSKSQRPVLRSRRRLVRLGYKKRPLVRLGYTKKRNTVQSMQ